MATNRPSAPCRPTRFSRPDRRLSALIGTQGRVSPAALPETDIDAQSPGVCSQLLCSAHCVTVRRSLAVPPYIRSVLLVSLYPLTCETNIDDEDFAGQTGRDIAPHPGARSYCQSTVKINHIARSTAFSGVAIGKKTEASRLLSESLSVGVRR
jgi:hypothetical protein